MIKLKKEEGLSLFFLHIPPLLHYFLKLLDVLKKL